METNLKITGCNADKLAQRVKIFGQPVIATPKVAIADQPVIRHQMGRAAKKAIRHERAVWWKSVRSAEQKNEQRHVLALNRHAKVETNEANRVKIARALATAHLDSHKARQHPPATTSQLLSGRLHLPERHKYQAPC